MSAISHVPYLKLPIIWCGVNCSTQMAQFANIFLRKLQTLNSMLSMPALKTFLYVDIAHVLVKEFLISNVSTKIGRFENTVWAMISPLCTFSWMILKIHSIEYKQQWMCSWGIGIWQGWYFIIVYAHLIKMVGMLASY